MLMPRRVADEARSHDEVLSMRDRDEGRPNDQADTEHHTDHRMVVKQGPDAACAPTNSLLSRTRSLDPKSGLSSLLSIDVLNTWTKTALQREHRAQQDEYGAGDNPERLSHERLLHRLVLASSVAESERRPDCRRLWGGPHRAPRQVTWQPSSKRIHWMSSR